MKNATKVNEPVIVTSLSFGGNNELKPFPRRMEYRGQTYNFLGDGLRCMVRSGRKMAQIFTVTDGLSDYRLRYDDEGCDWTLLSVSH